ncbi:MAG: AhpC/TSA family protein [Burkholderiales bacterium]|nr:AhpC/TSA family protein [Burkholderiales bacterium]MDE2076079.1 AhpC/TSA family protein [Burkholderiales bacterium]MDE2431459.1 AhpC/TSA family protein [Burkholderiales bacterium]
MNRLTPGRRLAPLQLKNLQGASVVLPDPSVAFIHLQFRRFAGCPICNLHLRQMVERVGELRAAGIKEVVFFHSSAEAMRPYQGDLPFDCIADPGKVYYKRFGIESSWWGMLHPKNLPAVLKGMTGPFPTHLSAGGEAGHAGMPADFLIDRMGVVQACHYGSYADDQWSVDHLLDLAEQAHLADGLDDAPQWVSRATR